MASKPVVVGLLTIGLTGLFLWVLFGFSSLPGAMRRPASSTGGNGGLTESGRELNVLDQYHAEKIALATIAEAEDMQALRIFVGSVHHWHPGFPMILYVRGLTRPQLIEARNWVNVEVVEMRDILKDETISVEDFAPIALHDIVELHGRAIFVPPRTYLRRPITRMVANLLQDGFVMARSQDPTAAGLTGCCEPQVLGFIESHPLFHNLLVPVSTCAIAGTCRGRVAAELLSRFRRAVADGTLTPGATTAERSTGGARSACLCAASPAFSETLASTNTTAPAAREYVSHLKERDRSLVHRVHYYKGKDSHGRAADRTGTEGQSGEEKGKENGGSRPPLRGANTDDPLQGVEDSHSEDDGHDPHEHVEADGHEHSVIDNTKTSICLLVPSTTRGKQGEIVDSEPSQLPLFNILVQSFLATIPDRDRFSFALYLGIDIGDPMYDDPIMMRRVQAIFDEQTADIHMHLVVRKFGPENRGAPAWFWNGLFEAGYQDGCQYFYQINDDVQLLTPNWASSFVDALAGNPRRANLGMAGPADVGNQKTMTQAFTHRTHYDIFGTLYPRSLKNWYSDDWATHIYDDVQSTFWQKHHQIRNHNPRGTRYQECGSCDQLYRQELADGKQRLSNWLLTH